MIHLFYDVLMFADLDDGLRDAHHDVVNNRIGFRHFLRLRPEPRLRPRLEGPKREGPTKTDLTAAGEVERRAQPAKLTQQHANACPVDTDTRRLTAAGTLEGPTQKTDCGRRSGQGVNTQGKCFRMLVGLLLEDFFVYDNLSNSQRTA
jgi:hypothetical protein